MIHRIITRALTQRTTIASRTFATAPPVDNTTTVTSEASGSGNPPGDRGWTSGEFHSVEDTLNKHIPPKELEEVKRVLYGLNQGQLVESLKVPLKAQKIAAEYDFDVNISQFKGNKDGYLDLVCGEMMEKIASENLADYVDVFCEKGYFSVADTNRVLQAGKKHGLIAKTHVNQFTAMGGVAVSVKNDALSVDHLEVLNKQDITALQESQTMPVALPLCSYFLSIPYTPGREIIDAGLPLALASDYNPGSSPSGNMNFVVATACIKMKLSPEEAINAATINGAYAMGLSESHGSITKGKKANLIITKEIPSYGFLPYAFGSNNIDQVILNGTLV